MKKVLLMVAVAAFAMTTTSCKKDYTCTCTDPVSTYNPTADVYTYQMNDVKKKDAKAACNSLGSIWIINGGTCEFK